MSEAVGPGAILAYGGTNARVANYENGDVTNFNFRPTPGRPDRFFKWTARQLLQAAHDGREWLVVGVPGPIGEDDDTIGPMSNVKGMSKRQFSMREKLRKADPAVGDVIEEGFNLVVVNDGTLAAHAAAIRMSNEHNNRVAALIVGTGIGAGVVDRDPQQPDIFRTDHDRPYEIGHKIARIGSFKSFEQLYAGPAIEAQYDDPRKLDLRHQVWGKVAWAVLKLSTDLGQDNGVDLVVPCGGIGSGASWKYGPKLTGLTTKFLRSDEVNNVRRSLLPEIVPAPPKDCDIFEMYGAEGVMRELLNPAGQPTPSLRLVKQAA
jgi:hypothetical protein